MSRSSLVFAIAALTSLVGCSSPAQNPEPPPAPSASQPVSQTGSGGAEPASDPTLAALCRLDGSLNVVEPSEDCVARACGDACTFYDDAGEAVTLEGSVFHCNARKRCVPIAN